MGRRKKGSPISFFSFQDIMMCVCGLLILITLLLTLRLVDRNFGKPDGDKRTTRETFDETLRQILDLEAAVRRLESEITSRSAVADANVFLNDDEIRERIKALETEIALLKSDVERNETVIERNDAERERIAELLAAVSRLEAEIEKVEQKIERFESERADLAENTFFISNRHESGLLPWLVVCNENDVEVVSFETGESQTHSQSSFLDWAKTRSVDREYFVFYVRPSAVGYYERLLNAVRILHFKTGLDLIGETTAIRIVDRENQLLD